MITPNGRPGRHLEELKTEEIKVNKDYMELQKYLHMTIRTYSPDAMCKPGRHKGFQKNMVKLH